MEKELEKLNPLSVLKRGYNLTYKNDKLIKSIKDISKDDMLTINMHDGKIVVKTCEVIGGNYEI